MDANDQLWPYLMRGGLVLTGLIKDCYPVALQECAVLGNGGDCGKRLLTETA